MCQCYQIGGPFIAEDPSCPVHGTEAQAREARVLDSKSELSQRIAVAESVEDFRDCLQDMLALIE